MDALEVVLAEFVLGNELAHVVVQFGLLLILSLLGIYRTIKVRVGGLGAIVIASYPRLCVGLLYCNLIGFTFYRLLLLINPAQSVGRSLFYVLGIVLSYPIYGIAVGGPAWAIGRGRDIQVITDRYRGPQPSWLIDLTKNHGETAQFVPRGSVLAYFGLIALSGLALLIKFGVLKTA